MFRKSKIAKEQKGRSGRGSFESFAICNKNRNKRGNIRRCSHYIHSGLLLHILSSLSIPLSDAVQRRAGNDGNRIHLFLLFLSGIRYPSLSLSLSRYGSNCEMMLNERGYRFYSLLMQTSSPFFPCLLSSTSVSICSPLCFFFAFCVYRDDPFIRSFCSPCLCRIFFSLLLFRSRWDPGRQYERLPDVCV